MAESAIITLQALIETTTVSFSVYLVKDLTDI
jgi:hypothetical protein